MPTFEIQSPDGRTFEIDGPDQAGAIRALQTHLAANGGYGVKQQDTLVGDVAKSAAAGVGKGAIGIAATPNLIDQMAGGIVGLPERAYRWATGSGFTLSPETQKAAADYESRRMLGPPSADTMQKAVEQVTGEFHKPQTTAGKYAETVGEFLPASAMSPGNLGANLLKYGVAPGITSEAAGQATAGTKLEPYARIGAALATIPLANAAGNRIADALAPADAMSSMSPDVRRYVTKQTDPALLAQYKQKMQELGPDAVLADVSEEFKGLGRAAASRTGSRGDVVDALNARDAGKNARVRTALDNSLGPAPIKNDVEAGISEAQQALRPEYGDAFRYASRVDTKPIADALDTSIIDVRGPAQKAMKQVRDMLNVTGTNQLDPNPKTLFETRQAIDGMISGEQNPKVVAALSEIRQRVDDTLAQAVPGIKDVDAKFQELARQKEGLQTGVQSLDSGRTAITPTELARDFPASANPSGTLVGPSATPMRIRQGARAELERIVGNNVNDVSALQKLLKGEGDWNRDRMRTLFGQGKADDILKVIDSEKVMQDTRNYIVGNSATEQTRQANKFLDAMSKGREIPLDTTVAGASARNAQKLVQALTRGYGETAAEQAARDFAKLATAKGAEADALVQALLRRVTRQNQGRGGQLGTGAAAIIRALSAPSSN